MTSLTECKYIFKKSLIKRYLSCDKLGKVCIKMKREEKQEDESTKIPRYKKREKCLDIDTRTSLSSNKRSMIERNHASRYIKNIQFNQQQRNLQKKGSVSILITITQLCESKAFIKTFKSFALVYFEPASSEYFFFFSIFSFFHFILEIGFPLVQHEQYH